MGQPKPAWAEPVLDPAPAQTQAPEEWNPSLAGPGAEASPVNADTSDEKIDASKPVAAAPE